MVAFVALVLSVGGVAFATVPDSSGVIHACYNVNAQGQVGDGANLRVVDPSSTNANGQACNHHEREVSWNQTVPAGPTIIRGGTYADGTVYSGAGTGFTLKHTGTGTYEIDFPAGTWTHYPIATFQSFFGGPQAQITFASGDGTVWDLLFTGPSGPVDTTFDFIFMDGSS
jgi:hypothetical protein